MNTNRSSVRMTLIAVFAALMVAGTFIRIPLGTGTDSTDNTVHPRGRGYPRTKNRFSGGSPVSGPGSPGHTGLFGRRAEPPSFLGPTGGFLAGYLPAAFITGLIIHTGSPSKGKEAPGISRRNSYRLHHRPALAGP